MRRGHFLLLLAAALVVTSCITVDKTTGGGNIPEDYNLQVFSQKFRLPLRAKMADSLQALSSTSGYLGAIRTPEFGLAEFSCATNFCPYVSKSQYGKDQQIKSFYIQFLKKSDFIAEPSQEGVPQNFHVYRMTRTIDKNNMYNNTFKPSDYIPFPIDSGGVIYTGGDTLTIRLKHSFAKELLNASRLALDSLKHFIDEFKGLLFTSDSPEGYGGRVNEFEVSDGSMYLSINFQPTWAENLKRKDTTLMYVFGVDYVQNFSTYESKALETSLPQEFINVEGCGGLKAYIDAATLKDTLDNWAAKKGIEAKKVIIGKATYCLPYEKPEVIDNIGNYYPQYLYPASRVVDTSGVYYNILNDVYTTGNSTGVINRSLDYYSGDISGSIQSFFRREKADIQADKSANMWFMSVLSQTNTTSYYGYGSTTYSTDLGNYSVGRINGSLNSRYPYLEIVYTIAK